MKKVINFAVVFIVLAIITCLIPLNIQTAYADDQDLFTEGASYVPNVLIILDNSQSMDEDFVGNLVGPWHTNSRLVEAKRALQAIVNKYAGQMRIGLMTYNLPGVSNYNVHNAVYFASYDPKSYCPSKDDTVLAACQDYCKTGNTTSRDICQGTAPVFGLGGSGCRALNSVFDATYRDEIITNYAVGSEPRNRYCNIIYPKTNRYPNPTDLSNYIYYKLPGTFYDTGNYGNSFCYAPGYNPAEGGDAYNIYWTKTGTADDLSGTPPGGYGSLYWTPTFGPTDEDIALGFYDFGRRMAWYYVGRTWFANSSPGGGYLHVPAATNLADNVQLNALLAKLDMKEGNESGYMSCSSGNTCSYIVNAGLTPIAGTLQTAIDYFKGTSSPILDSCQKNFVILVTDGLPSVNESGATGTAAALMPAVIGKVDALRAVQKQLGSTSYTFNILTYVVGMALTTDAEPYLDNMAAHGGTAVNGKALYANKPADIVTMLDNALSDIVTRSYSFSTSSISSSRTYDENFIYEATFEPVSNDPFWKGYLKKWSLQTDGSLNTVIWEAGAVLQAKSAAGRNIKTLIGGIPVNFTSSDIDSSTPVPYAKMSVADQATANKVIKYIRGYATDTDGTTINPDNWKLGDIFHSSPITLGTPSLFFHDIIDTNSAFESYRNAHPRASHCSDGGTSCSGYGKRMVITGANDGQFHAFKATTGEEFWSFIPPNLLPKLQDIYHTSNSSTLPHNFYVDGQITATDAWLPSGWNDGSSKNASDWKTLVMFSLGKNDRDYTTANKSAIRTSTKYWSSSASSCDTDIQETWDATHLKYCGYFAFDFTYAPDSDPTFKWALQPTATEAPYLGEPWSAISIGRVRIGGEERWIGVIGGGYDAADCSSGGCDALKRRGKGIIVFDLYTGVPIWSFTHNDSTNPDMDYSIPSQVSLVDSDNDGFIDRAYVGDIKGNMWQIKFCTKADLQSNANCGTSSWKGSLLLDKLSGSANYPLYYPPTVTRDSNGDLWVFWASGDKVDPTGNSSAARVYGLKALLCKDTNGNPSPCARGDSANITAYCNNASTKIGWYKDLAANEKVLAPLVAFNNVLLFTSFIPAAGSSDLCTKTGTAYLYAITIDSSTGYCNVGQGALNGGAVSIAIGTGIATGVTISFGPTGVPVTYTTISGAGGQEGKTGLDPYKPPQTSTKTNLIYWKDHRLQ